MDRAHRDELHDSHEPGHHSGSERGGTRRRQYVRPPVDIYSTETEMVVLVDMPGVRKEDLELTVERDELVIDGKASGREAEESALPWGYYRRFKLRTAFDRERISGHLEDGILKVTLPKAASEQPRKITLD